jgi:hypothetical protein
MAIQGLHYVVLIQFTDGDLDFSDPDVNKKMLKDKATLTLNLNDPFNVYRPGLTTDATTFFMRTDNRPESRYLTVTWNYRFGKAKQQRREHDGGSAQEEQHRVNL